MVNNDRFIKANELLQYIGNRLGFTISKTELMQAVEFQPTVDVVEVKHSKWEYHGGDDDMNLYGFCSKCHNGWEEALTVNFKYCPHCGAIMDGSSNVPREEE